MRCSNLVVVLAVAMLMPMSGAGFAAGNCRQDHAATDQNVRRARAGLEKLADGNEGARCGAYRRYVGALRAQRGVIERCDTGPNRAQNVSAMDAAIADYNKRADAICRK